MNQLQLFGFSCITEITIKADTMKSGRQNMLKEQVDEVSTFDSQRF